MAFGELSGRVSVLRDNLRTQLWPVPAAGTALAIILGVGLPQLDARIDDSIPPTLRNYLFGGDADAARTLLNAIGSSLITVTSLTFSLTVLTLQLASSQFSPRLLRTFSRDRFVHLTLALFLTTFTYSLVALRTVRTSSDTQAAFVLQISVTFALILTVASVLGLVLFLAHLASQIRLETILDNVHREATETLQRVLDERDDAAQPPAGAPNLRSRCTRSRPRNRGFSSASTRTSCSRRRARAASSCRSKDCQALRSSPERRSAAAGRSTTTRPHPGTGSGCPHGSPMPSSRVLNAPPRRTSPTGCDR